MKVIGKAAVQIIPTTEGIEGKLNNLISPAAGTAGGKGGENAGLNFAKKMVGAIAAAGIAAKVGGFVKDAVSAGGQMQQAIGGISTLFGDQAGYMVANAKNAWKTAGISANEYMENVTSFSASLLQSLNGDTKQAAVTSDRIMRDMADNANKFGTDMGSIQHAYQGFSKQNYTMLDNLKLGYGGTKTEAQRLVDEMSKMTDIQKELGIEVKEGDLSFGNLANAISVAQKRMGVMGTTAAEADGTLTGSFASMSAAFDNFKADLAMGNNVSTDVEALVQAVVTSFKNMIPMIGNVLTALPGALTQAFATLAENFDLNEVTNIIIEKIEMLPDLIGQFADWLQAKADGEGESKFGAAVGAIIVALGRAFIASLPAIASSLDAGFQILIDLLGSLGAVILTAFDGWVNSYLLPKGQEIITAIGNGIQAAWEQMKTYAAGIVDKVKEGVTANLTKILASGRELVGKFRDGIRNAIGTLTSIGMNIVQGIWSGISGGLSWIKNMITGWVGNVLDFIKHLFGIASPSKVMAQEIGRWIPPGIAVGIDANTDALKDSMKNLEAETVSAFNVGDFTRQLSCQPAEPARQVSSSFVIYGAEHQDEKAIARYVKNVILGDVIDKELAYA